MRPSSRLLVTLLSTVVLALPVSTVQAQITTFTAFLTGPQEAPPNTSPGTGTAVVTLNEAMKTMRVVVSFTGLLGNTRAAHIHCCTQDPFAGTAGIATQAPSFDGFPSGVTFGTYDFTFNMGLASSYRAGFVTDNGGTPEVAFSTLTAGMFAGKTYFNLHTVEFPGGEIRGFLRVVPEPATYALMSAGLLGLGLAARRRRA